MKVLKILFPLIFVLLIILFTYWRLPSAFFEQDEWLNFGTYIYSQSNGGIIKFLENSLIFSGGVHLVPLAATRLYLQIKFFQLNFPPYAILSILNHIINTFLLFYLAYLLLKNRILALFSSILYGISSISSQSVTWMAATINTQGSDFCLLLVMILLYKYIDTGEKNKKLFFLLLVIIFLGLLFKETLIISFVIFPLFWWLFAKEKNKKSFVKFLIPFFFITFFYFVLRVVISTLIPQTVVVSSLKTWENPTVVTYIYRIVTFPFKIIPQGIFPPDFIKYIANQVVYLGYPQYFAFSETATNLYVVETVLFDMVSYALGLIIVGLSFYFYRYFRKEKPDISKTLFFSLLLSGVSAFPYIFLPGRSGYLSFFEPRHLSIATIGASITISIILYGFASHIVKKGKRVYVLTFIFVLFIVFVYVKMVRSDIRKIETMGTTRQYILSTIYTAYPLLPKRVVFFTQSDTEYYGMPLGEKILPFQSGVGQTLLVWYRMHGQNVPNCFFSDGYLYDIQSEGYRECDGVGFGYYRKIDSLKKAILKNKLSENSIIAFSFDSKNNQLQDITASIRLSLK